MTYIDDVATDIARRVPSDLLPDDDTGPLFRLYALLALVKGSDVTAADVHDAWSVWMLARDPRHRSLKPFEELDAETMHSDDPFVDAIRSAAEDLASRSRGVADGAPAEHAGGR